MINLSLELIVRGFIMLAFAFGVELCGAAYTIALARDENRRAIAFSAMNATLGWVLIAFVVWDTELFPLAIIGEIAGTMVALKVSKRKETFARKPPRKSPARGFFAAIFGKVRGF